MHQAIDSTAARESRGPGHPRKTHVLHPGDVAWATRGETMETLLGSCVAVVLTDPRDTFATMCHIVHPGRAPAGADKATAWGENALKSMFDVLIRAGITPGLCEAHVFGGGSYAATPGHASPRVGERNVRWTLHFLEQLHVDVHDLDVGGQRYRKLAWSVGQPRGALWLQTRPWEAPGTSS